MSELVYKQHDKMLQNHEIFQNCESDEDDDDDDDYKVIPWTAVLKLAVKKR